MPFSKERKKMLQRTFTALTILLAIVILGVGFSQQSATAYELITKKETVMVDNVEIEVVRMADNFIVLFDSSSSMGEQYKDAGMTKLQAEKAILKERNRNLLDIGFVAGLYSFTPKSGTLQWNALKPYYEMQPYDRDAFAKAIDALPEKASGPTLLQQGLLELDGILSKLKGHTVVFVVSDGRYTAKTSFKSEKVDQDFMKKPVDIAGDLTRKYNVSFVVVSTAKAKDDQKMLQAVASINAESRVIKFDQFLEKPGYMSGALYVIEERLVRKAIDIERIEGIDLDRIYFDHNSAEIRTEYFDRLDTLARYLLAHPKTYVIFAGFADSTGTVEYNMELSRKRVEQIRLYLVGQGGVEPDRVILQWYGEYFPLADNDMASGRQMNRRVKGIVAGL
jgi:OOP family OmpA-OmpF porin